MTELGGRGLKYFFWQRPNRRIFYNWGLPKVMRERSYEQILFLFLSGTRFMFPPPCCMTNRGITPGSSVVAPILRICSSYCNRTTSTSTIISKCSTGTSNNISSTSKSTNKSSTVLVLVVVILLALANVLLVQAMVKVVLVLVQAVQSPNIVTHYAERTTVH